MQANEVPDKIYLVRTTRIIDEWRKKPSQYAHNIEYTRTDVFIEKACNAYCKVCKMPNCRSNECKWLSNFKEHLETI